MYQQAAMGRPEFLPKLPFDRQMWAKMGWNPEVRPVRAETEITDAGIGGAAAPGMEPT